MGIRRKPTILAATAAALLAVVTLTGCGERGQNAQKAARDTAPAVVLNFPQGFRNVAFKCYGTVGIYVTSRGDSASSGSKGSELPSSVSTQVNDPNCQPGRVPSSVQVNPGTVAPQR